MSLPKMSVLGAFNKLPKKRNDVARLVFEHNLTDGGNAKKSKVLSGSKDVNYC